MGKFEKLQRDFFRRAPQQVARELLGKYLVREIRRKKIIIKIVETEAYGGREDKGCHVYRYGLTRRTAPLFGEIGRAYVYPVHINMYCFNIVSHKDGGIGGVLIRAGEPVSGIDPTKLINGPAKLCNGLKIDKSLNGEDLLGKVLFATMGEKIDNSFIKQTERINIPYAQEAKNFKWRYVIRNSPFLSVK